MCEVLAKYPHKEFIGYKEVIKQDGKYYSAYDGRLYDGEVGKYSDEVDRIDVISYTSKSRSQMIKDFWEHNHDGLTAALLKPDMGTYEKTIIVKVKLTGQLYHGRYEYSYDCVLGSHIEVLEEVQDDEWS